MTAHAAATEFPTRRATRWRHVALLLAVGLLLACTGGVPRATAAEAAYAPVEKAGPRLSVPAAELRRSLVCTDLKKSKQRPVLLVPATTADPHEQHAWNYMRLFDRLAQPYCTVTLPKFALEDMQISGEYVVSAIRTMHKASGRKIVLLGGSQGGSLPRWALRFWPDTRPMVAEQIALAPTNHGSPSAVLLGPPGAWAPSIWQQMYGSAFIAALNSTHETFRGIDYTVIYSQQDAEVPFFLHRWPAEAVASPTSPSRTCAPSTSPTTSRWSPTTPSPTPSPSTP